MKRIGRTFLPLCLALGALLLALPAHATMVMKRNLVELIDLSDDIVVGRVLSVTDGFQGGVPYTEVRLLLEESIRGGGGNELTFRQFGLLAPRDMGNGYTNLNVSPDGWPRFAANERVMVFLAAPGSQTGFRTTVGLMQGKFDLSNGSAANVLDNAGMFDRVVADPGLLNGAEQKLMELEKGGFQEDTFRGLVRRAVKQQWIEEGRLRNAN